MTTIGVIIPLALRKHLFTQADQQALEACGTVRWYDGEDRPTLEQAVAILADADIGIGSWRTPHPGTEGLLANCPKLKMWEHVAGSVKAFFNEHSADRDLVVGSCKGAIADCVAEMTLGEMIVGLRQVWQDAQAQRQGGHGKPSGIKVLETARVGIVGASEVGKRVARLLQHFGCTVQIADPFLDAAGAAELGATLATDLTALCASSDVVTLHTPLLDSTRGLLGAEQFQAMADDTIFINCSRGPCIDEAALITELQQGRLFAFLDVTDPEPCAPDSPLRSLDNVVLTSHTAGPATTNMGRQCLEDVRAFLAGGMPDCTVTCDMLERIA